MTDGPSQPTPPQLRVLTYNVRGLRAGVAAVARVIASAEVDVVCVQEGPADLRWRSKAADLARRSGLYVVTGGRPARGNLLLCAPRVDRVAASDHLLSRSRGLPPRGCAAAVLRVSGATFGLIGTHFGLRPPERRRHATEVADLAQRLRVGGASTVIVAGDFNSKPSAREWEPLLATWHDSASAEARWSTFPANAPTARIDLVFVEPGVTVTSCGLLEHIDAARASDHRPVLAVLELAPTGQ